MSERGETARSLTLWAGIGVAVCALGFGAFYLLQFRRDNAAAAVDLAGIAPAPAGLFFHVTEDCRLMADRVVVRGWAVRKGQSWPLTRNRVVMRLADGRVVALDTAWLQRPKLAGAIHAQTRDKTLYYAAGFAASLNLAAAGINAHGARLFVDWEQGNTRALLPLDCAEVVP